MLARCRDGIPYLYIVHRLPNRIRARHQRSTQKGHHTQIARPQASKAFTALLRRCPFFEGVENPPTLYECKSLGIAQLRNSGWSKGQVQRLAGHRSVQMTEHYAKGHEAPFDEVGIGPHEPSAHKRKRPETGPIRY